MPLSPPSPALIKIPEELLMLGFFVWCIGRQEMGKEEEMTNFIPNAPSSSAKGSRALPKERRSSPTALTFAMH